MEAKEEKKIEKTLLEKYLTSLMEAVASMEKDNTLLKDPQCFSALEKAYEELSMLKTASLQPEIIIADLPRRLGFYYKMLIALPVKAKSGAFLDEYMGGSDIHSYIEFINSEINLLRKILRKSPNIQDTLVKNKSIKLLIKIFFLGYISNDLQLEMLDLFKLLDWKQGFEQLPGTVI